MDKHEDLVRRLTRTLDLAVELVGAVPPDHGPTDDGADRLIPGSKAIPEAAMLLYVAATAQHTDGRIAGAVGDLARALRPHARTEAVLAALCLDPSRARQHAVVHSVLSWLGDEDSETDELLQHCLAGFDDRGPELLPHRELEQRWLERVWAAGQDNRPDDDLIARSSLGRPLDILGATAGDLYAFTHAVVYASDFGSRRPQLTRSAEAMSADADAALARSLDFDDLDLTAEILWTWPMLGVPWSPLAMFAVRMLMAVEDEAGVLPGLDFDLAIHSKLTGETQREYRLSRCYHSTFVLAFVYAAALVSDRMVTAPAGSPTASGELLELVGARTKTPRWVEFFARLPEAGQAELGPFLLSVAILRARNRGDLVAIRTCLLAAGRYGLLAVPLARQALGLLQRSVVRWRAMSRQPRSSDDTDVRGRAGLPAAVYS